MPLIIMTGIPSSGKTTRVKELASYFESKGKRVIIVSEGELIEKANFDKNSIFLDSAKEKHIRSVLKSEVLKLVDSKSIVILDGLNYIKGFRYELYCGTKSNKCTQCIVHTEINHELAWHFNLERNNEKEQYSQEVFDALRMRYENPESKNRWDSPLFTIFPNEQLDFDTINSYLFNKTPPPPNQSTQNPPLSSTNFLYDLDRVTKEITDGIVKAKNMGIKGEINIPGCDNMLLNVSDISTAQLMILRRQYITYSKMHAPDVGKIPQLYVQYLQSSLNR